MHKLIWKEKWRAQVTNLTEDDLAAVGRVLEYKNASETANGKQSRRTASR